ncbi:flippase-like domain-containing protein [bacterium]|nr:flippase-like domain-containing protein [bacterium]
MNRQFLNFGLRIVVSLFLLGLLISRIDVQGLLYHLKNIDAGFLTASIICFLLYIGSSALRWQIFITDTGIQVNFYQTLKTLLIGFAIALFLPSAVGIDVGRTYNMARSNKQKVAILSTVLMDRLMGFVAVIGMAMIAILIIGYRYLNESILIAMVGVSLALGLGWMFFFNKQFIRRFRNILNLPIINRFADSISELYFTIYYMQRKPRLFSIALIVSLITAVLEILSIIMLSYAIGDKVDPLFFFIFMPIIWIILIIPISIGGLGVRETVFVFFFTQVGMDTTHAVTVSLLYYMMYVFIGIIGGAIPIIHGIYSKGIQIARPKTKSISEIAQEIL